MLGILGLSFIYSNLFSDHIHRFKILHRFIKDSQEHCSRVHIGIGTQRALYTSSGTRMTKTSTVCESWFTLVLTAVMMIDHGSHFTFLTGVTKMPMLTKSCSDGRQEKASGLRPPHVSCAFFRSLESAVILYNVDVLPYTQYTCWLL